ncbi:MAG: hypothetical protein SVZ03_06510 [Spirochaetota bacterium]|nr:hypothetical protein [Spirochaetota bacterium]
MGEPNIRTFAYKCKCGFVRHVFIDFGIPKEFTKCLNCKNDIKRQDL